VVERLERLGPRSVRADPEAARRLGRPLRRFEPGEQIVLREIWNDTVFLAIPVTVVSDSADLLAIFLRSGTVYQRPTRPTTTTDWLAEIASGRWTCEAHEWHTHARLGLTLPDAGYSVSAFWDDTGGLVMWYVDLIRPFRRTSSGFEMTDLVLDIVIAPDLASWHVKDEAELEEAQRVGLITGAEAETVWAESRKVIDLLERGEAWWTDWRDWAPDPSWPIPTLPDTWNVR
jgi:hypothetical protein